MTPTNLLSQFATDLETFAGATTTANASESGYWLRIALALESIAGQSSTGNTDVTGYARRAAVAAEVLSGEPGVGNGLFSYLRRIVAALASYGSTTLSAHNRTYAGYVLEAINILSNIEPPSSNLLTNPTFDSGDNWTLSTTEAAPTIGSGQLTFPESMGEPSTATQTLVGGSVAAGNYNVGLDVVDNANGDSVVIRLLGAANEIRGFTSFVAAGAGQTAVITASGEVSKFQIRISQGIGPVVLDNATMSPA